MPDASIKPLDGELQAAVLIGRNGAAQKHFVGIYLRGGLLDVSDVALDEFCPARPATAFPTTEFGFEATCFGQFQKSA